jgi:tetratricopeptide (TPR) repeat protein
MSTSRIERLRRLAAAEPNDPFVQYGLGIELMNLEEWPAALEAFERVLALDAAYAGAHLSKAKVEFKLGQTEAARATLSAGIAVAERRGDAHAADLLRELLGAAR